MLMLGKKPVSPLCMPYAGIEKATNCLLEIPQNLKCEISNGTLTLKAGSKVAIPASVYTELTIAQDLTISGQGSSTDKFVVCVRANGTELLARLLNNSVSGPNATANGGFAYDTTTQEIWYCLSDGTKAQKTSYPICVVQQTSGTITGFVQDSNGNDMIFNGAGFIGHHAFVYPGVKALASDEFNSDGSLKNVEINNNALRIVEMSTTTPAAGYEKILQMGNTGVYNAYNYREVESYNDLGTQNYSIQYVKKDNIIYYYNSATYETRIIVKILSYSYDGTTVSDFAIQKPLTKYRWVVKLIP